MNNVRWRAVLFGAAAFLVAHNVERALWMSWFADRSMVAWFTNSGRAVVVTVLCMLAAGMVSCARIRDRRELWLGAANVAGGGIIAMIFALFAGGPGTLFPLVIAIGGSLVIAGAFAGAAIVSLVSRAKG